MRISPIKVLIVDDEESIRHLLRRQLEGLDMECVIASSGHEALEKTARNEFDLILLDVKMPGISGLEVLEKIKRRHPRPYVLMISALADVSITAKALILGADDYITKPWDINYLGSRLSVALEMKELGSREITRYLISQQVEHIEREVSSRYPLMG